MSGSTTQEASTETPTETPVETLQRLEKEYVEAARHTADLKDQLLQLQDKLLSAQDASHRALMNFTTAKEQYLVGIIQNSQSASSNSTSGSNLPTIPEEPRSDNV